MVGCFRASPLARHWVKAPAMPWEGISVRGTHDPEVRAGGTGTPVLSPTRARGGSGDNAPRPPQAGLLPKPGVSRGGGRWSMLAYEPVWTGPAWAVTGQLWGWRALSIAARGLLGPCLVPDYNAHNRALYINIRAHLVTKTAPLYKPAAVPPSLAECTRLVEA